MNKSTPRQYSNSKRNEIRKISVQGHNWHAKKSFRISRSEVEAAMTITDWVLSNDELTTTALNSRDAVKRMVQKSSDARMEKVKGLSSKITSEQSSEKKCQDPFVSTECTQFDTRYSDENNADDIFLWLMHLDDSGSDSPENCGELLEEFICNQNKFRKKSYNSVIKNKSYIRTLSAGLLNYDNKTNHKNEIWSTRRSSYSYDERTNEASASKHTSPYNCKKTSSDNSKILRQSISFNGYSNSPNSSTNCKGFTFEINPELIVPNIYKINPTNNENEVDDLQTSNIGLPHKDEHYLNKSYTNDFEQDLTLKYSQSLMNVMTVPNITVDESPPHRSIEDTNIKLTSNFNDSLSVISPSFGLNLNSCLSNQELLPRCSGLHKDLECSSTNAPTDPNYQPHKHSASNKRKISRSEKKLPSKKQTKMKSSEKTKTIPATLNSQQKQYCAIQKTRRMCHLISSECKSQINMEALIPKVSRIKLETTIHQKERNKKIEEFSDSDSEEAFDLRTLSSELNELNSINSAKSNKTDPSESSITKMGVAPSDEYETSDGDGDSVPVNLNENGETNRSYFFEEDTNDQTQTQLETSKRCVTEMHVNSLHFTTDQTQILRCRIEEAKRTNSLNLKALALSHLHLEFRNTQNCKIEVRNTVKLLIDSLTC